MTVPVALGINLNWVKPALLLDYARFAEALGFESIWMGEHVAVPVSDDWWQGEAQQQHLTGDSPEYKMPFYPNSDFLDPLTALASVAAVTEHVRLGVGIYILALRNPLIAGRAIATLDVLSRGRLDLAVGLGWLPDEYTFTGNAWSERGRKTDEAMRCLRVLFDEEKPAFDGEFVSFPPIGFEPKPAQKRLPLHVGGESKAAARRAATLGDGWYGQPALNALVREELEKAGRGAEGFAFSSISVGPATLADLEAAAALGTTRCVVTPWEGRKVGEVGEEGKAELEAFCRAVGLPPR